MPDLIKTEITVEQIVQDFGDYYLDNGQNESNILMLPFEQFETRDAFMNVPTNDTVVRESTGEMSEILQPYQDEFTPKGSVEFKPVSTFLHKMKIDQEFNPHKLQKTWLGFLSSNKTDVTQWPFIKWFIEKYLFGQSQDDIEMKAVYKGVRKEPDEGVPGDAVDSMDGMEKIITTAIAGGDLDPINTGAWNADPSTFVDQIEDFILALPEKYRYMTMELNMSRTNRDKFKRGMRAKYKMNYDPKDISPVSVADFDNISIVGRPCMIGKDRIWGSPKYNMPFYVKGFENAKAFQVEKAKRKVAIYTEWWLGLNIMQPEIFFCNELS